MRELEKDVSDLYSVEWTIGDAPLYMRDIYICTKTNIKFRIISN
jgi:hypothetical protein